uniref:Small ribosomal subunit protein uS5c n=1 Tax=Eustigmatophyceae sp. Mont 10/10-1w TaxID=2506145 RepID=A0A3R5QS04_9STRA|nr:ribosomal protein S5 [Eustigmatophyceae sp. Mont 10/10-1w]QAA11679.1 ribosomal protein S5 [Eustigmatophyceae sp. Mont 10/10-1w]
MKRVDKKGIDHKVVEIRRVCKVNKGGKTLSFRALVVVGNQNGTVGIGIGKASQVLNAIKKGQYRAIQNRIRIPMTQTKTIPHKSEASYGASKVVLRPAAPGSGVIAGGAIRAVLELAGIKNILAKQIRSKNKINNAKATVLSLKNLRFITTTASLRGISLEAITGRIAFKDENSNTDNQQRSELKNKPSLLSSKKEKTVNLDKKLTKKTIRKPKQKTKGS